MTLGFFFFLDRPSTASSSGGDAEGGIGMFRILERRPPDADAAEAPEEPGETEVDEDGVSELGKLGLCPGGIGRAAAREAKP